jgi:chlorophyll synthase
MELMGKMALPIKLVRDYFIQMKPLFWGVTFAPFYIAWAFASDKAFPTYISRLLFIPDTGSLENLPMEMLVFILGLISMGPFLGGATILYNDYWDYVKDKNNRRKKNLPLLKGRLKRRSILFVSSFLFLLSLLIGFFISYQFMFFLFLCILLCICYSTPPIRLKERPGIDLLTNLVGIGLFCSLAGWVVVRPISEFPILWAITCMLGVGAIYMPTTMIDYEPDKAEGVRTIATHLGKRRSFFIGMAFVIGSNSMIILMSLIGYLVDRGFLVYAIPIIIAQIGIYYYLLRGLTFRGGYLAILFLAILLGIGNTLMVFYHAGILMGP